MLASSRVNHKGEARAVQAHGVPPGPPLQPSKGKATALAGHGISRLRRRSCTIAHVVCRRGATLVVCEGIANEGKVKRVVKVLDALVPQVRSLEGHVGRSRVGMLEDATSAPTR